MVEVVFHLVVLRQAQEVAVLHVHQVFWPRIADVHNGGRARGSQRVVNAESAAAALRSDAGAARPRLGLELGPGSRGRWRKGRCVPGPATGRKCAPPDPPSRPLGQCAGRAKGGVGPLGGAGRGRAGQWPGRPRRGAGLFAGWEGPARGTCHCPGEQVPSSQRSGCSPSATPQTLAHGQWSRLSFILRLGGRGQGPGGPGPEQGGSAGRSASPRTWRDTAAHGSSL